MTYRLRIAAWVVLSCSLLIGVMMFAAHSHLEEELRQGRWDRTHPKHPDWTIHNSYSQEEIDDILGELVELWMGVAAPLIVLSLGAGLLLARRSLRPMNDINRQLSLMAPDSLVGNIQIPEADPAIEGVVRHLNQLLGKAGQAYREMAEFSSKVAHELRTPLMLLRMRVEQAPAGTSLEFQEELHAELARLGRFVERSLLATKAEQEVLVPKPEPVEIGTLVRELAEDYQLLADENRLQMTVQCAGNPVVPCDPDLLRQALHGLLENAVRYADSRVEIICQAERDEVRVHIQNDYCASTAATPGLGLGLRLVRGICKASGLSFEHSRNEGEFSATIRFPGISG